MTPADRIRLTEYLAKGRARIENTLWTVESRPDILFLDGEKVFGLFDYNRHGSAVALPGKTCVLIGPEGANVDVVAHELVHADMAEMLGYWKVFNLPAWINEGVAMQVDRRERYDVGALGGVDARYVTSKAGRDFYADEVDDVVRNYAAARHLFDGWTKANGVDRLVRKLRSEEPDSFRFPR